MYYKSVSAIAGGGKTAVLLNTFSKGLARCSGSNWVFFPDPNWLCAPGANTGIADSDFLGRRLVRKDFINAMVKWRQGVIYGQWRIHESDFLKIEISVPSVEEQRKIGAYLDQLDNLITLHQRELKKLQNIKKSMLEKMFV